MHNFSGKLRLAPATEKIDDEGEERTWFYSRATSSMFKGLKAKVKPAAQLEIHTAIPLCLLERVHSVTSYIRW